MRRFKFILLVAVVVAIGLLHFLTPGELVFYHDTYRRLSYFPIVLGALWFGLPGGLALAVLSSVAFIPHLLLYFGQHPQTYLSELTEVILYLAAGTVTGFIAGREARLREKYRALSEKLEKSYARLHRETELLLEVEEQLSASQKFSALGQLSASLAHEIKNPLSSIRGTAEILVDEFPPGHPKREFVEILRREVDKLNRTVEEVLQFSRSSRAGGMQGEAEEEALATVLQQVATLLEGQLRQQNIAFTIQGLERGRDFYVDGAKLSQVFLNLILNAMDAVGRDGTIELALSETRDGFVQVTVADSGPGIAPDRRERVFDPFFSDKDDGTGLGLAISRKIVESYGGTLTLTESALGGAAFTVSLPRRDFYRHDTRDD